MPALKLLFAIAVAILLSSGPAFSQFKSYICPHVSRATEFWSDRMKLTRTDTTIGPIGPLTESTYKFEGFSPRIEQTFHNRCTKNSDIQPARTYFNIDFTMVRRFVLTDPIQKDPPGFLISYMFKSYIDPVKSQLGGQTLWGIKFFDKNDKEIIYFKMNTKPEPNCTNPRPVWVSHTFEFPVKFLYLWEQIDAFRVSTLPFDTLGRCEHN